MGSQARLLGFIEAEKERLRVCARGSSNALFCRGAQPSICFSIKHGASTPSIRSLLLMLRNSFGVGVPSAAWSQPSLGGSDHRLELLVVAETGSWV